MHCHCSSVWPTAKALSRPSKDVVERVEHLLVRWRLTVARHAAGVAGDCGYGVAWHLMSPEIAERRGQVPPRMGGSARCPPSSGIAALAVYLAGENAKILEQEELRSGLAGLRRFIQPESGGLRGGATAPQTRPLSSEKTGLSAVSRGLPGRLVVSQGRGSAPTAGRQRDSRPPSTSHEAAKRA